MYRKKNLLIGWVALASVSAAVADDFSLLKAIPGDAFLAMGRRHNPERAFEQAYWGEVWDALVASGVGDDVMDVVGSLLSDDQRAEVERIKARFTPLLEAVDWREFCGDEMAFGERMRSGFRTGERFDIGPPEMVFLSRSEDAEARYEALTAILRAVCDEINKAAGAEALPVDTYTHAGATVSAVNLTSMAPGAPQIYISIAWRDDVVALGFGRDFLHESLDLLAGSGDAPSIADDPRFAAAFEALPPAEDMRLFFDMQSMLRPIRQVMDAVASEMGAPDDVYRNTGMNSQATKFNSLAMGAYRQRDYQKAFDFVKQGHDLDPKDAILLYNLACFSARLGHTDEALDWLDKAVEGGFYAPGKISSDADLTSLHDSDRFKAAVRRAGELASLNSARDVVENASKTSEAYKLVLQAHQLCQQEDYEQALRLTEQAAKMAPSDSRVLYMLACVHATMDHQDQALECLRRSVDAGYYCPKQIAGDANLKRLHDDKRYAEALELARSKAAGLTQTQSGNQAQIFAVMSGRIMSAVSIFDYIASVEYTEGYTVHAETIAALVPDAKSRPFYKVLASTTPIEQFDRFVPQEAESFSISGGLDLSALYDFLIETVGQAGPKGEGLLDKWNELQADLGFDIQSDLLAWIGHEFTSVTFPGDAGSVFLVAVKDESLAREKASQAIDMLSEHLADLASTNPGLAMLAVSTSDPLDPKLAGFQRLQFAIAPTRPLIWGVADGRLIVGSSEEAVAMCLGTANGEHPSIRQNARAMSELASSDQPCVAMTLTDQRHMGEQIAKVLMVIGPMSGMMGMVVPDPDARKVIGKLGGIVTKLAPVASKINFFKSNSCCTTFDGAAWRTSCVRHYQSREERAAPAP